jgi:low affinity Fe/Cu permease
MPRPFSWPSCWCCSGWGLVILLQNSQNRGMRALEIKQDAILAALEGANNRLLAAEQLSDAEQKRELERYRRMAEVNDA